MSEKNNNILYNQLWRANNDDKTGSESTTKTIRKVKSKLKKRTFIPQVYLALENALAQIMSKNG